MYIQVFIKKGHNECFKTIVVSLQEITTKTLDLCCQKGAANFSFGLELLSEHLCNIKNIQ